MVAESQLICPAAELEDGGRGVRFELPGEGHGRQAFVIRFHGQVYGYRNECGHVPAQLDWLPGEFFDHSRLYLVCSVHGALYAPESGRCLLGRCAGRGLKPVGVSERDGNVYLDEKELDV